jgi:hypothetical protein
LFARISVLAAVAQSVEQRIRNAKVTSSIPVSGTKKSSWIKGLQAMACSPFFFLAQLFGPERLVLLRVNTITSSLPARFL